MMNANIRDATGRTPTPYDRWVARGRPVRPGYDKRHGPLTTDERPYRRWRDKREAKHDDRQSD